MGENRFRSHAATWSWGRTPGFGVTGSRMRRKWSRLGKKIHVLWNDRWSLGCLCCAHESSWILSIWSLCTCIHNLCVFPVEAVSRMLAEGFLPIRTWQNEQMGFSEVRSQLREPCFRTTTISHPASAPFQPLHPPQPAVHSLYSLMKASDHIFMVKPLHQIPWCSGFLKVDRPDRLWVKVRCNDENCASGLRNRQRLWFTSHTAI